MLQVNVLKKSKSKYRMEFAKMLKKTFEVDILTCKCGGTLSIVAAIVFDQLVEKILKCLKLPYLAPVPAPARAPPQLTFEL